METITLLIFTCISLIALIFIMRNFRWIIIELRNICTNESGYIKLIQLIFIVLVMTSFFVLLIDSFFNRELTSKLDLFLTVIVGLMGTIIGTFFSERTMESIKQDRDIKKQEILKKLKKLSYYPKKLDELMQKLN